MTKGKKRKPSVVTRGGKYEARRAVGGVSPDVVDVSAPLSMVPILQVADRSIGGLAR